MKTIFGNYLLLICVSLILTANILAQEASPKPTPPDDVIKIDTEEVHLNVTAENIYGESIPELTADDLLIVESGDPQTIKSIKRLPASVLILLDTGGNINFAKSINKSRLTAKVLVAKMSEKNVIAVLQSYNKIETVSDWTNNQAQVQLDLDKKLFTGNYSRFYDSIESAIEMFKNRPLENRHLVFIGDGLDSIVDKEKRRNVLQDLLAANITVHIIGYNKMEAKQAKPASRRFQFGEKKEKRPMPDEVFEAFIESLPKEMKDPFRRFAKSERLFVLRLDNKQLKLAKKKMEDWAKYETELESLAEDTGGISQFPEELETMWILAVKIANTINSQYVVTYEPTKPFAESKIGEERKVRVSTHRNGIRVSSRQKIIVSSSNQKEY